MPNIIPVSEEGNGGKSSLSKEDVMSPQLRAQFRALQHMHCEQQRKRSRKVKGEDEQDHVHTSIEDTDDETLSTDQIDLNCSQPSLDMSNHSHEDIRAGGGDSFDQNGHPLNLQMAISTAINAQNEIDALLKSIAELESMVDQQGSCNGDDDGNKSTNSGQSKMEGTEETSLVTIVD